MGADAKAPTVSIETVLIVRPIKVLGLCISIIGAFINMMSITSAQWLLIDNTREGLWESCIYNDTDTVTCGYELHRGDWIMACQGLCILSLVITVIAIFISTKAINNMDHTKKYKLYWLANGLFFVAVAFQIISLVIFPLKFLEEHEEVEDNENWSFGWAYIVGWVAAAGQFAAGLFFLIDKGAEEIVYREKVDDEEDASV